MTDLERWKRCVVHLEAAADSVGAEERMARFRSFAERLRSDKKPPTADEQKALMGGTRDVRYRGTAVFLEHERRRYLITARHVLTDENHAQEYYGSTLDRFPDDKREMIDRWIFPIIFRVPSLDELLTGNYSWDSAFLMSLGAGTSWSAPYTFSAPDTDLAVISLDQGNSIFADALISAGYRPMSLDDIKTGPPSVGEDVVSIGYPDSISVLGTLPTDPAVAHWASSAVSLPVFSWGRVAMSHEKIRFFWADLTIYPGNSGGPVVESDRLIGIVSAQARVEGVRVPFAKVIQAGIIPELIDQQIKKDASRHWPPFRVS